MITIGGLNKTNPDQSVTVEYDGPKGRTTKTFKGSKAVFQARSFYARQYKTGKNPKISKAER